MKTFKRPNQKRGDTPQWSWRRAEGYYLVPVEGGQILVRKKPKAAKGKAAVKRHRRARLASRDSEATA